MSGKKVLKTVQSQKTLGLKPKNTVFKSNSSTKDVKMQDEMNNMIFSANEK